MESANEEGFFGRDNDGTALCGEGAVHASGQDGIVAWDDRHDDDGTPASAGDCGSIEGYGKAGAWQRANDDGAGIVPDSGEVEGDVDRDTGQGELQIYDHKDGFHGHVG